MNMLRRTSLRQFLRFAETAPPPAQPKFLAERLANRSLIRVHGEDVVPFLQGLITNDMNHLHRDKNPSMFTMFLNNSGRVLYDAIIYRTPGEETYLVECDKDLSAELRRHLRLYRVRRNIDIECISSDYAAWVVYNPNIEGDLPRPSNTELKSKPSEVLYTPDPRVRELGARLVQPSNYNVKDIARLFPRNEVNQPDRSQYNEHRYAHGVGEGAQDHPPGKCFPLEANCDFLHGVSFQKGCYVGQELTARVYHTGVVRKRLMPLKLTTDLEPNITKVQTQAGAVVGNIRSASHRRALALLRVEQVLNTNDLMIDGELCNTYKPHWWPNDLPLRPNMRFD